MNLHFAGTTRSTHGDAMRLWDAAGYLASGLVVLAFCMKDIIPLRVVALTSNIAFLTYGIGLGLVPVWLLHAILLPINCWRLWQGISRRHALVPVRGNGQQAQQRSGVMLVTSRETRRWIIPKGWPHKGKAPHHSAAREAFEEAGVVGAVRRHPLGSFAYEKRFKNGRVVLCEVHVFPLKVRRQNKQWPERRQRE